MRLLRKRRRPVVVFLIAVAVFGAAVVALEHRRQVRLYNMQLYLLLPWDQSGELSCTQEIRSFYRDNVWPREQLWQWYHSYVSGRPDLSSPYISAPPDGVYLYFTENGVPREEVNDLAIAWRFPAGVLLRCSLSATNLEHMVQHKKRRDVREVLGTLQDRGYVRRDYSEPEKGIDRVVDTYLIPLHEYPLNRLPWWPPEDTGSLTAYEGTRTWEVPEVGTGRPYIVFVDEAHNVVYVVGH